MKTLIAFLLLISNVSGSFEDRYSSETWIEEGIAHQFSKFNSITFTSLPADDHIVAVNCEYDFDWSGRLLVFHHTENQVDWFAEFPKSYTEFRGSYVVSCRWIYLNSLDEWALEVIESTHRGNGSMWLWSLNDKKLQLLLHTKVRGQIWDSAIASIPMNGEAFFVEDLKPTYGFSPDVDPPSVTLTGDIITYDVTGEEVATTPYSEKWIWDEKKRIFTVNSK